MSRIARAAAIFTMVLLAPVAAQAQASIAGTVSDTSGAVLSDVTVEASSPALAEKVRTVITDAKGQYRVSDLPEGTYTITFALARFATIKREGVKLNNPRLKARDSGVD